MIWASPLSRGKVLNHFPTLSSMFSKKNKKIGGGGGGKVLGGLQTLNGNHQKIQMNQLWLLTKRPNCLIRTDGLTLIVEKLRIEKEWQY